MGRQIRRKLVSLVLWFGIISSPQGINFINFKQAAVKKNTSVLVMYVENILIAILIIQAFVPVAL